MVRYTAETNELKQNYHLEKIASLCFTLLTRFGEDLNIIIELLLSICLYRSGHYIPESPYVLYM